MLTTDDVAAAVREVAAERPDFMYEPMAKYDMSLYLHEDSDYRFTVPGCIIGHALLRLGLTPEQIAPFNNRPVFLLMRRLEIEGTVAWLNDVQCAQDDEMTWSQAVRYADEQALIRA